MLNDDQKDSKKYKTKLKILTKKTFKDTVSSGYIPDSSAISYPECANRDQKRLKNVKNFAAKCKIKASVHQKQNKLSSLLNLFRLSSTDSKLDRNASPESKFMKTSKDLNKCPPKLKNSKDNTCLIRKLKSSTKLDEIESKKVKKRFKNESDFKKIVPLLLRSKDNEIKVSDKALTKENIEIKKDNIPNLNESYGKDVLSFKKISTELKKKSLKSCEVEKKRSQNELINLLIKRKKIQKEQEENLLKSLENDLDINLEWCKTDIRLGCDKNQKIVIEPMINSELLLDKNYGEKFKNVARPYEKNKRSLFKFKIKRSSKSAVDLVKDQLENDAKTLDKLNKDIENELNKSYEIKLAGAKSRNVVEVLEPVDNLESKKIAKLLDKKTLSKEPEASTLFVKTISLNSILDQNLSSKNLSKIDEELNLKPVEFEDEIRNRARLKNEIIAKGLKLKNAKINFAEFIKQDKEDYLTIDSKSNNEKYEEQVIKIRKLSDEDTVSKTLKENFKFFNRAKTSGKSDNEIFLKFLDLKGSKGSLKSISNLPGEGKFLKSETDKKDDNLKCSQKSSSHQLKFEPVNKVKVSLNLKINSSSINKLEKTVSSDKSVMSKEDCEK